MRALVVELEKKHTIVLDKQGEFIRIRRDFSHKVGQELAVSQQVRRGIPSLPRIVAAAAVLLLVAGLSLSTYGYFRPYSYIDVDINPSVEITTNVFDRILKVNALNADGEKIIQDGSFTNKTLAEGVRNLLDRAIHTGYLKKDTANAIVFTVSSKKDHKSGDMEKSIRQAAERELKSEGVQSEIHMEKVQVKQHDEALKQGISPGKQALIRNLKKLAPQVKEEEYKNKPVKEILRETKEEEKKLKVGEKLARKKSLPEIDRKTDSKQPTKKGTPSLKRDTKKEESTHKKEEKNKKKDKK